MTEQGKITVTTAKPLAGKKYFISFSLFMLILAALQSYQLIVPMAR